MSAVKVIYKAPVKIDTYTSENEEELLNTIAFVDYDGIQFIGIATLNPEDKDFYSPRIGKAIATSRARIEALRYARDKAIDIYNIKRQFWKEIESAYEIYDDDSWSEMIEFIANRNIRQAKYNIDQLRKALKKEKKDLYLYLKDLDRVVYSVKRQRAMAAAGIKANED